MKISVLGSSSAGNCVFVEGGGVRLLVDAGLSREVTFDALAGIGVPWETINAVLITHEHSDHVAGIETMMTMWRRYGFDVNVYMTPGTAVALKEKGYKIPMARMWTFKPGCKTFEVGGLLIGADLVSHDAAAPVAYTIGDGKHTMGVVTDLGVIYPGMPAFDWLLLEANHDADMLRAGPYEHGLKQRILGEFGHLSNDQVCEWIREDLKGRPPTPDQTLVLGHISLTANHVNLVWQEATKALVEAGLLDTVRLVVADPLLVGGGGEVFVYE